MAQVRRILNDTDVKYKIICAGKAFDIGSGMDVSVEMNGRYYNAKMHSKSKGRIDGLTALYNDNSLNVGDLLELEYNEFSNIISIKKINGDLSEEIIEDTQSREVEVIDFAAELKRIQKEAENTQIGHFAQFSSVEDKKRAIEAFNKCESVVFHREYYNHMNYVNNPRHMAVNRSVIIKLEYNEGITIYNEEGEKLSAFTYDLGLNKNEYESLLGINNQGIWFQVSKSGKYAWNDCKSVAGIICLDIANDCIRSYKINANKKYVRDVYIAKNIIAYVSELSEDRQELMCLDVNNTLSEPVKVYTAYKGQSISNLSVYGDRVAFYLYDDNDKKTGWKILQFFDFPFGYIEETALIEPVDASKGYGSLIEIHMVDLARNIMFTSVTEKEKKQYSLVDMENLRCIDQAEAAVLRAANDNKLWLERGYDTWAIRQLGNPVEGRIATFKANGKPAVWYGMNQYGRSEMYFDGKNCYYPISYMTLIRVSRDSNMDYVGNTGHGECDKILVSDNYVFVNCDAYDLVRLPRNFKTHDGFSKDNPEAMFIFGKGVDFRM